MKLVDLSNWIEPGMPVHPYDEKPNLFQDKFLEKDGFNNYKFEAGTHIGTHLDSPMHMTENSQFIGEYDLDSFCGKSCIIDVRGKAIINYEPEYESLVKGKEIVLLYTGFDREYGNEAYYNFHPIIEISFTEFLVRKKIKMLGMDMPSPDRYPFQIHKYLFSNGLFILENLRNLSFLLNEKDIEVFAFPLKIKADASWVRAVARIL